jgi:hypothetical protein
MAANSFIRIETTGAGKIFKTQLALDAQPETQST